MNRLEASDVLVVTKLDRLGRNAIDVAATVAKLEELVVRVHCLALADGMSIAALARKFATSRQIIMRVRNERSHSVRA